jgi:hypothetical protein
MSAHDRRDGIGDFGVAEYLVKFDEVHLVGYCTPVLDFGGHYLFGGFGGLFLNLRTIRFNSDNKR